MKSLLLCPAIAVAALFQIAQAQPPALQFFPLDSGNVWQYYATWLNPVPPDSNYYLTVRVAGDTVMPNGKSYKILDQLPLVRFDRTYVRIDSLSLEVKMYLPFNACADSEIAPIRLSLDSLIYHDCRDLPVTADTGRSQIGLVHDTTNYQSYSWFDGFSNHYIFHKAIGISFFNIWELAGIQGILNAAIINGVQYGTFVGVKQDKPFIPNHYALEQNYPNPFNPTTRIRFSVPSGRDLAGSGQIADYGWVTLKVFDVLGREVSTLVNGMKQPGEHTVTWNASNHPSGIYFYRLTAGGFTQTKSLLLLK